MKIISGIMNKVLIEEQFEDIATGKVNREDLTFMDTIKTYTNANGEEVEYLPIRIASIDVDHNGKEKFIYDEDKKEYKKSYMSSQVLNLYGKEMRIALELGEYAPVKVVFSESQGNERTFNRVVCVQDQTQGLVEK